MFPDKNLPISIKKILLECISINISINIMVYGSCRYIKNVKSAVDQKIDRKYDNNIPRKHNRCSHRNQVDEKLYRIIEGQSPKIRPSLQKQHPVLQTYLEWKK